jgi:hypothetical protein
MYWYFASVYCYIRVISVMYKCYTCEYGRGEVYLVLNLKSVETSASLECVKVFRPVIAVLLREKRLEIL